jgi:hypothetical protein
VLAFEAIVAPKTAPRITAALEAIRTRDVVHWCHEHLGLTLQAQRRYAFAGTKTR